MAKRWRRVHIPRGPAPPVFQRTKCRHCRGAGILQVVNGAWLRWLRESARLDQRTFGETVGLSGPYISDIENNRRECPVEVEQAYRNLRNRMI